MTKPLDLAMDTITNLEIKQFVVFVVLPVVLLVGWAYGRYTSHINVPAVGVPPGILGRWKAPYRWKQRSQNLIIEGMAKYGVLGKPFKIATPARWIVFLTDPTVLNELRNISPSIMSFRLAADGAIHSEYTFHKNLMADQLHIEMLRKNLKVGKGLPQTLNETLVAWKEMTNIGDDWTEINPWTVMLKVVSRSMNLVLVGSPLCRNDEFLDNVINFTLQVVETGNKLDQVPDMLRAFTVKYILPNKGLLAAIEKYVNPIFQERRRQMKDQDQWNAKSKPDDTIQWLLDTYPPETEVRILVLRLLFLEFASIHTTSVTIVQVLFDLAANPAYQAPLREEIETQLHSQGWTAQALANMKKLDSVLRESARINGTNIITVIREVITPHTFSDGTHVTKGAWVAAPSVSIHHWDKIYENPDIFDGYRFYEMRKAEGNATKYQNVSTSLEYLPFGDGPNACPGRFFATKELKVMLSFILCNYEFKFENGVKRPTNFFEGLASFPDSRVGILIRKRKGVKDSAFFSSIV